ncbi:hypothetical protein AB3N59_18325 [Leptospira sp. WS92.C1]
MKKKLFYVSILFVLTSLTYIIFSDAGGFFFSEKEEEKLKSGLSRNTVDRQEGSMFESGNFLDFSKSGEVEDENTAGASASTNVSATEPAKITPEEREKLRKEMILKAKPLAEKFPNNSLIPRELTKEQENKKKQDEEKMNEIRAALLEGREVAKPEMEFYLDSKIKRSDDMTEILEYSIKVFKETGRNYPASSLKVIEDRLHSLRESKNELLDAKKNLDQLQ